MDYARLTAILQERLAPLARDEGRFQAEWEVSPGLEPTVIDWLEGSIAAEEGMVGFRISPELRRLYAAANGLSIYWVNLNADETIRTSETSAVSYGVGGFARTPYLPELYEPGEPGEPRTRAVYDRYKLFDWADGRDHVSLRFARATGRSRSCTSSSGAAEHTIPWPWTSPRT